MTELTYEDKIDRIKRDFAPALRKLNKLSTEAAFIDGRHADQMESIINRLEDRYTWTVEHEWLGLEEMVEEAAEAV